MATERRRRIGVIGIMCALVIGVTARARAAEIWVAPTSQQDVGGLGVAMNGVWPVTPAGAVRFAWAIPGDLQTFQSARLVIIPSVSSPTPILTFYVCTAQSGQIVNANCSSAVTQGFTSTGTRLLEVDISAAIGARLGTPGASYVSVLAFTTPTTTTDHVVGLRFAYAPKPASGVPTLGANVYTGTQTAPAFVGDGSGLTNIPAGPTGPTGPQGPPGPPGTQTLFGTNTNTAVAGRGQECTMGQIMLSAGAIAVGAPANGQLLPIQQNTALFSLLGTMYGGNGLTTFALPDLRSAAPNGHSYSICDEGIYPSRR